MPPNGKPQWEGPGEYPYGFRDPEEYLYRSRPGPHREEIEEISSQKNEPDWMRKLRLEAFDHFLARPMPAWGGNLADLNFNEITFYIRPSDRAQVSWDEVPETIKRTFDRLGIPEAERKLLAGVGAQYESEMVYHNIQQALEKQGVIFLSSDDGLRKHPDVYKEFFGTVVPYTDNKFAALNTAFWSGGSFVYVPPSVHVDLPLQAYFRLNAQGVGQFERTLIIVDEGASVHYVEGCTAPVYTRDSLHSGVIEIIVRRGARMRYTTIQNWSTNVYNLVTQRSLVGEDAIMEWVDSNLGSRLTMKYPACILQGKGAHGEILSMAFAGRGQHQDAGGKMIHLAPGTSSKITSKSISKAGGRSSYRGLVKILHGASGSKSKVVCDALLLDPDARTDTYPTIITEEQRVDIGHEATVSRIGQEQLFYLRSRGLSEEEAVTMVVSGFIEPLVKELPMEYAIEMNRLIQMQMSGSVG
ncbi:MAG: Fe-S cluster assembly protein SufB [Anaerolineales bacterium]